MIHRALRAGLLAFISAAGGVASATTFTVINLDTGTTGLNDATSFTPVGGNNATTLGQARRNVIMEAGRQWGLRVTSTQAIVIEAQMAADTCTVSSGTLATAGPKTYFTFDNAPNVLLPAALADAISGSNNNSRNDITMSINSTVGSGASCLNGRSFYLGLDHANGSNIDLLNVLLHEIGHGLGFISLTLQTGASMSPGNFTGFEQHIYSESLGKFWPAMTDAERASASVANGTLVYNGPAINANIAGYTSTTGLSSPGGHLRLYAPVTWSDGSSVSHWDSVATPDLLMEPFIRPNPQGFTDLTGCVLKDIGWPSARCPDSAVSANTPPVALAQTVAVAGDTPTAITLRGIDPDSTGPLTYAIVSPPTRGTLVAPASLSSASGVVYTYTASSNVTAADSFTFQVNDGQANSPPATVTLNITAINHPPVASAQAVSVQSGSSLVITLAATDADGNALTYRVVSNPLSGTLTGAAPILTYTPNAGFSGTDSFQFLANDGLADSAVTTVTVTVTAPPAAAASKSGGGGAMDALSDVLLSLLLLCSWQRRPKKEPGKGSRLFPGSSQIQSA